MHEGSGVYSGYWARTCTNKRQYQIPAPVYGKEGNCPAIRKTANGQKTLCWGHLTGRVNEANTRFAGEFYTCNNKRAGTWNGWQ